MPEQTTQITSNLIFPEQEQTLVIELSQLQHRNCGQHYQQRLKNPKLMPLLNKIQRLLFLSNFINVEIIF